jgi:hypothetical protein
MCSKGTGNSKECQRGRREARSCEFDGITELTELGRGRILTGRHEGRETGRRQGKFWTGLTRLAGLGKAADSRHEGHEIDDKAIFGKSGPN